MVAARVMRSMIRRRQRLTLRKNNSYRSFSSTAKESQESGAKELPNQGNQASNTNRFSSPIFYAVVGIGLGLLSIAVFPPGSASSREKDLRNFFFFCQT